MEEAQEKQAGAILVKIEDSEVAQKLAQMTNVCQEIYFQVKKFASILI
jgi:hypothetical protein